MFCLHAHEKLLFLSETLESYYALKFLQKITDHPV